MIWSVRGFAGGTGGVGPYADSSEPSLRDGERICGERQSCFSQAGADCEGCACGLFDTSLPGIVLNEYSRRCRRAL